MFVHRTLSADAITGTRRGMKMPYTLLRVPPLPVLCSKLIVFSRQPPLSFHASLVNNARFGENYMIISL